MKEHIISPNLIDLRTVSVDPDLQQEDRVLDYVRQIRDPYHFVYKQYDVIVSHCPDGPSLEECVIACSSGPHNLALPENQ